VKGGDKQIGDEVEEWVSGIILMTRWAASEESHPGPMGVEERTLGS